MFFFMTFADFAGNDKNAATADNKAISSSINFFLFLTITILLMKKESHNTAI